MTKERLRSYQHIKSELKGLERRLEELETRLYSTGMRAMDGMPKKKGKMDFTDILAKHIELEAMYARKLDELTAVQTEIELAINGLPPLERDLMRLRYLEGLMWEDVAVDLGYSVQRIYQIHGKALKKIRVN